MGTIRRPAVAGTFYPAEPEVLARTLSGLLAAAGDGAGGNPKALIAPHAGYIYSGAVAARAYARLAGARGRIGRVVVIGPAHRVAFRGLALDTAEAWESPLGTVTLDTDAVASLSRLPLVVPLEAAFAQEHALEVQLPFLLHMLGGFRLVPVLTGHAPPEAVAAALEAVWGGPETLIVVSSDLSHFLDYAAAQAIDARTAAAIDRLDPSAIGPDSACGCLAIGGLLLAARRRGLTIERLDLRNSADTAGPRGSVVGYGAWALTGPAEAAAEADDEAAAILAQGPLLLELARIALEIGFDTGRPAQIRPGAALPDLLRAPGAAFITLRRNHWLRGCIGSALARRPLAVDVVEHAFNAAFRDSRFPPLQLAELAELEISVSVLTPPSPMRIADEHDLLAQLRPHIDGLIIGDAARGGLFLPSVWEELGDPRQFLAALKAKAGLGADHFSPTFTAQRFRTVEVKGRMSGPRTHPDLYAAFAWTPARAPA
jgi:hypothetical protein